MSLIKALQTCIFIADVCMENSRWSFRSSVDPFSALSLLSQVYRGVRIGGLHMSLKHSQNKGAPHFPHDYPDCPAGLRFQEEQEGEFLDKFKRSGENCDLRVLNFTLINIIVRNTLRTVFNGDVLYCQSFCVS